ncbi:MAG: GNAT family N-acetyltransferase [Candidatus Hodarchaeales archaeon]
MIDSENKPLGRIGDALLTQDLLLDSLILFGSIIEEKMEDIGLREDIDPIVSIQDIIEEDIENKIIKINKSKLTIPTTNNDWKPPDNVYQLSRLKNILVYDENGEKIGTIIDIVFHSDKTYTLVLGGEFLRIYLKQYEISSDINLLIPKRFIKEISHEKIIIEHDIDLKTTYRENIDLEKQFVQHQVGFISRPSKLRRIFKRKRKQQVLLQKEPPEQGFRYLIMELPYEKIRELYKIKEQLIGNKKDLVQVRLLQADTEDSLIFKDLFNFVLMTSPDPYRPLTEGEARKFFKEGIFLAFLYGNPVGYGVITIENTSKGKIGVIAGIGVHPRHRRKRVALTIAVAMGEWFLERKDLIKLQCEVYEKNQVSKLFISSLGFEIVGEMNLD